MSLYDQEFPIRGRPIVLGGTYIQGDAGQEILRGTGDSQVIYVDLKRSWKNRLFSWPWKPWKAYYLKATPMRVSDAREIIGSEGREFEFTLIEEKE